jgi:hypothetical protein
VSVFDVTCVVNFSSGQVDIPPALVFVVCHQAFSARATPKPGSVTPLAPQFLPKAVPSVACRGPKFRTRPGVACRPENFERTLASRYKGSCKREHFLAKGGTVPFAVWWRIHTPQASWMMMGREYRRAGVHDNAGARDDNDERRSNISKLSQRPSSDSFPLLHGDGWQRCSQTWSTRSAA